MIHLLPVRWRAHAGDLRQFQRDLVKDWLTANGVDWTHVYNVEVRGRRIHVHEYRVDADGKRYVDRRRGKAATRRYSVRLRVEPPTLPFEPASWASTDEETTNGNR